MLVLWLIGESLLFSMFAGVAAAKHDSVAMYACVTAAIVVALAAVVAESATRRK